MFCIVHIIKNIRNTLFKKQNNFYYPRLRLNTGHVLEEGICSVKWMRELRKMSKDKIISSFRMNRNIAYADNLSKQKVSPALALLSRELTAALKKEFRDNAKGTHEFLKTMNDYVMQPLLTATTSKGYKIIEASVFNCKTDVRLQCFCQISSWLTDEWFPHLKKSPVNCNNTISENASSNYATNHATLFDCDLESCEDLICNFLDYRKFTEYDSNNDDNKNIDASNNDNKTKVGRKILRGGPSEETIFALAHTLRSFSDLIKRLLTKKNFKHVLTGKMNNDPIELRFSSNRYLAGHHQSLDICAFSNNERALLLQLISELCTNSNGSHNRIMHKLFFMNAHDMIAQPERTQADFLKQKWNDVIENY